MSLEKLIIVALTLSATLVGCGSTPQSNSTPLQANKVISIKEKAKEELIAQNIILHNFLLDIQKYRHSYLIY